MIYWLSYAGVCGAMCRVNLLELQPTPLARKAQDNTRRRHICDYAQQNKYINVFPCISRAQCGGNVSLTNKPVSKRSAVGGGVSLKTLGNLPISVVAAILGTGLTPGVSLASESAPEGFFDLVFYTVDSLGPFGPVVFVIAVALFECIPLFPTQPLSLASGLLFGAPKGAICVLSGTLLASFIAFTVARGVGRPLAERIIRAEMAEKEGHASTSTSDTTQSNIMQSKLRNVQETIERGSFWQQTGAIAALRLTPIIPFSASNYILGMTPLPTTPYLLGTAIGMAVWSVVYASLGGASRALLQNGVDPNVLLNDLIERAGNVTEIAGIVVGGGLGLLALSYGISRAQHGQRLVHGKQEAANDLEGMTDGSIGTLHQDEMVES